jgi:hypothetical protein
MPLKARVSKEEGQVVSGPATQVPGRWTESQGLSVGNSLSIPKTVMTIGLVFHKKKALLEGAGPGGFDDDEGRCQARPMPINPELPREGGTQEEVQSCMTT